MATGSTKQPAHGRFIETRREALQMSIRQAALKAGMSDSYWGQIERGYQTSGATVRKIEPSVGSLLQIAATLRLTDEETNRLLEMAGHRRMPQRRATAAPAGYDVDTTGCTPEQVRELNRLAEMFRRGNQ